jgi:hypothetical protein
MPPNGVISLRSISRKQTLDLIFSEIRDTTASSDPFHWTHILHKPVLSSIGDQSAPATDFSNKWCDFVTKPIGTFLHNKLKHQHLQCATKNSTVSLGILAFFKYLGPLESSVDMDRFGQNITTQVIRKEGNTHVVNLSRVGIPLEEAKVASEWIAKAFAQARKYSLSYRTLIDTHPISPSCGASIGNILRSSVIRRKQRNARSVLGIPSWASSQVWGIAWSSELRGLAGLPMSFSSGPRLAAI